MNVALIYYQLLDSNGEEQLIGGIESYLINLGELCNELGWKPILFQCADLPFQKTVGSLQVIGVPSANQPSSKQKSALFKTALNYIDLKKDILIFGADHCSVLTNSKRCISIQHGISWDLPSRYFTKKKLLSSGLGSRIKKLLKLRRAIRHFENCQNRVCVDYNFLNWYRTMLGTEPTGKVWVIPNSTSFMAKPEEVAARKISNNTIRILFARRFTPYRGVRIMGKAAKAILQSYENVNFTFAGEGPEKRWLMEQFSDEPRVAFTKYYPNESMGVHLAHDIAVIPSISSEGTSLSVAEAMGAGCVVVATAVGGITNMIIDGYNGILVNPDATSLLAGLQSVVRDPTLRRKLGNTAYEVAKSAFNLDIWKKKWSSVIEEVSENKARG